MGTKIDGPQVFFLDIAPTREVRPYMDPYHLWVDYSELEFVSCPEELVTLNGLRSFQLHRIAGVPDAGTGLVTLVSMPHCMGYGPIFVPSVEEQIPALMVGMNYTMTFRKPSRDHFGIRDDSEFKVHLKQMADLQVEAETALTKSKAQQAASSKGKSSKPEVSSGKKTTMRHAIGSTNTGTVKVSKRQPTGPIPHEVQDSALCQMMGKSGIKEGERDKDLDLLPSILERPTPQLVLDMVDDLLRCFCSFHLQAIHEMGSVRMVDCTLAEGIMSKFSQ